MVGFLDPSGPRHHEASGPAVCIQSCVNDSICASKRKRRCKDRISEAKVARICVLQHVVTLYLWDCLTECKGQLPEHREPVSLHVAFLNFSTQEGPSSQHLRTLVPKTINGMVFGTRVLKYWLLGPCEKTELLHAKSGLPPDPQRLEDKQKNSKLTTPKTPPQRLHVAVWYLHESWRGYHIITLGSMP